MNAASQFDYSSEVLRRFSRPAFAGSLEGQRGAFVVEAGSRAAGASVRFWLLPKESRVDRIRFEAYGCPHFIAAADALAEWSEGQRFDELLQWSSQSAQGKLQVPASKRGRLLVLENALKKAYEIYISTQTDKG